ncbi:hypothetical protein [Rhodospira trueperi]|uniref:Uncharacterized protein n=1 Tax=Rhodospira trueperi TaxID=69960 RepID=A0A1G7EWM8_9PROT|nr:hypothetical protein [Rhodospira trueperi]SDE68042.1 hypothetical protein SAMN05421720_11010 [Rhodospira trueperi]
MTMRIVDSAMIDGSSARSARALARPTAWTTEDPRARAAAAHARVALKTARSAGRAMKRHDTETFGGTAEPAVTNVLNDPLIHSMMHRDGVPLESLQALIRDARARLRAL